MTTSTEVKQITVAFLNAQKKIESVIKDSSNPFFKSKYADLTAVIDACKDKLNAEGIAILQPINGMTVETILIHTSGEWFSSQTPIVSKDDHNPQALGSAITYAKRYGLQSMVLLPAEDDDGQRAVIAPKYVDPKTPMVSMPMLTLIHTLISVKGYDKEKIKAQYKIQSSKELTYIQAKEIIDMLQKLPDIKKI